MSGHFYKSEILLKQGESYTCCKTAREADEGDHPAFKHEYPFYETVLCTEAAESLDVIFLFNDEHGEASEDIKCNDNDYEYQDHVYGSLFILHHLIEGFVLLETVLDSEIRS